MLVQQTFPSTSAKNKPISNFQSSHFSYRRWHDCKFICGWVPSKFDGSTCDNQWRTAAVLPFGNEINFLIGIPCKSKVSLREHFFPTGMQWRNAHSIRRLISVYNTSYITNTGRFSPFSYLPHHLNLSSAFSVYVESIKCNRGHRNAVHLSTSGNKRHAMNQSGSASGLAYAYRNVIHFSLLVSFSISFIQMNIIEATEYCIIKCFVAVKF